MNAYDKPPIGVSPHWFVYRKRITELNEAIGRQLEYIENHQGTICLKSKYQVIAEWAKEIEHLARLEAELR